MHVYIKSKSQAISWLLLGSEIQGLSHGYIYSGACTELLEVVLFVLVTTVKERPIKFYGYNTCTHAYKLNTLNNIH